jgi:hypothetical protein
MHGDPAKGSVLNKVEVSAIRSGVELGDFDQLPLDVELNEMPGSDNHTHMWSTTLELANLKAFDEIRIAEYEMFRMTDINTGFPEYSRRLIYLAHLPLR